MSGWDQIGKATPARGARLVDVHCGEAGCGRRAGVIEDSPSGPVYKAVIELAALTSRKEERRRAPLITEPIEFNVDDPAQWADFEPDGVPTFCPRHRLSHVGIGDLRSALAEQRRTRRRQKVVASTIHQR